MKQKVYIFFLFCFSFINSGQGQTGYIRFDMIIDSIPEYVTLQETLEDDIILYQDTLNQMESKLHSFLLNGIPHRTVLDTLQKLILEDSLKLMQAQIIDYLEYAQVKTTQKSEILRSQLLNQIRKELIEFCAVNDICLDDILILSITPNMYCTNYTERFIKYLKQKE